MFPSLCIVYVLYSDSCHRVGIHGRIELRPIKHVIKILSATGTLPEEYRPHQLKGDHKGQWECHIQPNWLMTWEQNDKQLTLLFLETGTHADIFGW